MTTLGVPELERRNPPSHRLGAHGRDEVVSSIPLCVWQTGDENSLVGMTQNKEKWRVGQDGHPRLHYFPATAHRHGGVQPRWKTRTNSMERGFPSGGAMQNRSSAYCLIL